MAIKVHVPRLGEGVDELTILKWLKKEGDQVKEMESLLEVETDKVVTEIPSPAAGILVRIIIPENTPAKVGDVMALIGEAGESIPETSESGLTSQSLIAYSIPAERSERSQQVDSNQISRMEASQGFLSPVVRKLAAEHNVNLVLVQGSGLNGRITKQDVLDHLARQDSKPIGKTPYIEDQGAILPITPIRRQIAERMQHSKQISPHVMTVMEADMTRIVSHRNENKAIFSAEAVNLTFTAYFLAAIAVALKSQPLVNSSWTDKGIFLHKEVNIGMATSLGEEGLIVPVLRNVNELSLLGIARAVNDLAARARSHQLLPGEVRNGTFTLTNHGIGGSLFAMPIINQPQCGILGVGTIHKRPIVLTDETSGDSIAIHPMVYLSFVFDHRILDGASADLFLFKVKETLEEWH